MKKKIALYGLLAVTAFGTVGLASCKKDDEPKQDNPEEVVKTLNITGTKCSISKEEAANFDLKTLFSLTDDSKSVAVEDSMLVDKGGFKAEAGKYTIKLEYKGQTATSIVTVLEDGQVAAPVIKTLKMTGTKQTISVADAADFDLKTLFSLNYDDAEILVEDSMLVDKGGFKAVVGTYTIKLSYEGQVAVSVLTVVNEDTTLLPQNTSIELSAASEVVEIGAIDNLDLTSLFTIMENGQPVKVTDAMIDDADLNYDETGEYEVVLTYKGKTATSVIHVVHNYDVTIVTNTDALVAQKNSPDFDLKECFSLYVGEEEQPIVDDMIAGEVNLSRAGRYKVDFRFDRYGEIYRSSAVILVLPEVIIATPQGDHFEDANVYTSNAMFQYNKLFTVTIDGNPIPFDASNVDSNITFNGTVAETGHFTTNYNVVVSGVVFSKSITYDLHEHAVTTTTTTDFSYNISEVDPTLDIFDLFNVKVDGTYLGASSSKFTFVEASEAEGVQPEEGKTLIPYTLTHDIAFDQVGDYPVKLQFTLDGVDFEKEIIIHIIPDVEITEASKNPVSVMAGVESYDFKTLFKITKYNPDTQQDESVTVEDSMIEADVDFTKAGVYTITCTYEGVSFSKEFTVEMPIYVGTFTALDGSGVSLTIHYDGTAVYHNGKTADVDCTYSIVSDVLTITTPAMGTFTCQYEDDLLTLDYNHSSVKANNCAILARDVAAWTKKEVTNIQGEGMSGYTITELTNVTDPTIQHVFVLEYTYEDYSDEGAVVDYNCTATYYVNPIHTGTLFEGSNVFTLGSKTETFQFTTVDDVLSFTVGSTTTPSETGVEAGTYTGSEGTLTLDGKGKITVTDSTTIVPNYSGVSYEMVNGYCMVSWNDSNYQGHSLVLVLDAEHQSYAIDDSDDGFKRFYAASNYCYFDFLGNGVVRTYSVFKYGNAYANYEVFEDHVVVTWNNNGDAQSVTLDFSNGENLLSISDYPEDLYTSNMSYTTQVIVNHKLTVLNDIYEVAQGAELPALSELFKIEYTAPSGDVELVNLAAYVDLSAVDTSQLGYHVATIRYQDSKYTYEATAVIHVYAVPYQNHEYTGEYFLEKSYSSDYYLRLNADGTAEYVTYNTKKGTWSIGEDNSINIVLGSDTYTAKYEDGVVLLKYQSYGNWVYTYGFKNGRTEKIYSKDNKKIFVVTSDKGITKYYYLDNETGYGEVNALFAAKELADGVIVELRNGKGEELLEAKISGSSSFIYAGPEKGTYHGSASNLTLDGFGTATYGTEIGIYETYKTYYKISLPTVTYYMTLNLDDKSYVIEPDSVVLAGLTKEYAIEVEMIPNTHLISAIDKENWFKFTTAHGGIHTLSSDTSAFIYDKAWVYDEAGNEIASFTSSYSNFKISAELAGNTTYWLKIELNSTKSDPVDDYFLSIAAPVEGAEKGSYTGEKGTIELDGFGAVTIGSATGTYKIVGEYIQIVMSESDSYYIRLNTTDYVVEDVSYIIDNSAEFTFVLDETTNEWKSNNAGKNSSTATLKIMAIKACTVSFLYKVSTESSYDKCTVYVNGVAVENMKDLSGVVDYQETATVLTLNAGDVVTFEYKKDSSTNKNDDTFYIKNLVVTKITE